MPATWTVANGVLVISTIGETTLKELRAAFDEALASPEFAPGAPLIIESLRSTTLPDNSGMRGRVELLGGLPLDSFQRRIILVVRTNEAVRFGLARQIALSLSNSRGVEVGQDVDLDEALAKARQLKG
jgi:hypothetical protein